MKTIIAGSRTILDYEVVREFIDSLELEITEVVSGGAVGPDIYGEKYACDNKIPIKYFPADWKKYGKAAGPIRNEEMVDYVGKEGQVIVIWDGESHGTLSTIRLAKAKGVPLYIKIVKVKTEEDK